MTPLFSALWTRPCCIAARCRQRGLSPILPAFIFDQEDRGDIQQRLVAIDEVERRRGFDFLSELPDAAEDALEAAVGVWPLP